MKKYAVIYTDFGDSCDFLARMLGKYDTKEQAAKEMKQDAEFYLENEKENGRSTHITEEDNNFIFVGSEEYGCKWQIIEL